MKVLLIILAILLSYSPATAWDFTKNNIPTDEIMSGGPPKDGIPALFSPDYVPAAEASYMRDKEEVMGVVINNEAKAYPLRIMSWHELVNDSIGGIPILVSW